MSDIKKYVFLKLQSQIKALVIVVFFYMIPEIAISQNLITKIESLQSLYIVVRNDTNVLGQATGFVIKSKSQNYLVTNWHVVTNKNAATKTWINPKDQNSPNNIIIFHNTKQPGSHSQRQEKLLGKNAEILYHAFTTGKDRVDVVAIPLLDTLGDIALYPVDYSNFPDSVLLRPTDRLFVLGFPKGQFSAPFLPVWKSGLIASEPDFDQETKPIMWLDIDAFPGMSGSPVYLITDSFTTIKGGNYKWPFQFSYFIGVFSHGSPDINVGALWKGTYLKKLFSLLP